MKTIKIFIIYLLLSNALFAEDIHNYFVVDGSGSMSYDKSMEKGIIAMKKLAKHLFSKKEKVSLIVASGNCGEPRIITPFFDDFKSLEKELNSITTSGRDKISAGFKYAEEQMAKNNYTGHIYMFGDGDGLETCEGITSIAEEHSKKNTLTPFIYLGLNWDNYEKENWNKAFSKFNAKTFDYNEITKARTTNKVYFKDISFVNIDGTLNDGNNYINRPWKCIKTADSYWLVGTEKEELLDFVLENKSLNSKYKIAKNFIDKLNRTKTCGVKDWDVSNLNELSALSKLSLKKKNELFPNLRYWPHISISKGLSSNYKKGIDLSNRNIYDYRVDRPYSIIFVSKKFNENFEIPEGFIESEKKHNQIESKNVFNIKPKEKFKQTAYQNALNINTNNSNNIKELNKQEKILPKQLNNGCSDYAYSVGLCKK